MTALWLLPVVGFVVFGWWAARDLNKWVEFSRDPADYDIFASTRRDIQGLPEKPELFDQEIA